MYTNNCKKIKEQYSRRMFKKIQNDIEINLKKIRLYEVCGFDQRENFQLILIFIQIKKQLRHFGG